MSQRVDHPPVGEPGDELFVELFRRIADGDPAAHSELMRLLYDELRSRAASLMHRSRPGDTLQPTALLHEAYVRALRSDDQGFECRSHFVGVLVKAMKCVLVDRARAKACVKRGGDRDRELLATGVLAVTAAVDALELDDALSRLAEFDPQAAHIVELRFFVGLRSAEVAELLGVSTRTVERDWKAARAWLRRELA